MSQQQPTPVVFHAAIRQTQGGLCQGSNGDGLIVAFDIPEIEASSDLLAELMRLRRADLIVTVMRADDVKGQSLLSPVSPQDGDEKANSGQPERKNGTPTQRKGRGKMPKADTRTVEQIVNGKAWALLLHGGPHGNGRGFASCPDVRECIQELAGKDDHERLRVFYGVPHLYLVNKDEAKARLHPSSPACVMIDAAWRDASTTHRPVVEGSQNAV